MIEKHYLNLSNGLEAAHSVPVGFGFLRMRSTTIERAMRTPANWANLFAVDLDHDFLVHLAVGNLCVVHDRGTRRQWSKTMTLGLTVVRYVLNLRWHNIAGTPTIVTGPRGGVGVDRFYMCSTAHDAIVNPRRADSMASEARSKIDYYKRFLGAGPVRLEGRSEATEYDGDVEHDMMDAAMRRVQEG